MRVAVFQARSIPGRSLILGTQPLPLLPCEAGARTGAPSHEVPGDRWRCAAARGPSMPVRSVTGAAAQARQRSPDGKGPKSRSLWRDVSHQNGTTRDGIRLAKTRKLDPGRSGGETAPELPAQKEIPGDDPGIANLPAWAGGFCCALSGGRLRALGQRADQLVLAAVADLPTRFAGADIDNRAQRSAEIVLALNHV